MASHFGIATLGAGTRTNSSFIVPASAPTSAIAIIHLDVENDVTPTPPSGYTQLQNIDHTAQPVDQWIWWKRLGAGEGGTTHTVTHASTWTNGALVVVQDVSASVNPTVSAPAQGTSTTYTANSVTPIGNNAYIGYFGNSFQDMGTLMSPPAGTTPTFTEQYESANNVYVADGTLATAGATGTKAPSAGSSVDWMASLVVVEDVATTGDPFPAGYGRPRRRTRSFVSPRRQTVRR